jgi:hypothetical protein
MVLPRSSTSRRIRRHRRMSSEVNPNFTIAVDENLILHEGPDTRVVQSEDPLEHDYLGGHDLVHLLQTLVSHETVPGQSRLFALQQVAQNVVGLVEVQRLRVVEVVLLDVDVRFVDG